MTITALLATGWKAPMRFTAKARDKKTDIWGVIYRPTNLDKSKKYPVIEHIYAGPQGAYTPKRFSRSYRAQALAELLRRMLGRYKRADDKDHAAHAPADDHGINEGQRRG